MYVIGQYTCCMRDIEILKLEYLCILLNHYHKAVIYHMLHNNLNFEDVVCQTFIKNEQLTFFLQVEKYGGLLVFNQSTTLMKFAVFYIGLS